MIDTKLFRDGMSMLGGAVSVITTDGEAGRFWFYCNRSNQCNG